MAAIEKLKFETVVLPSVVELMQIVGVGGGGGHYEASPPSKRTKNRVRWEETIGRDTKQL